MAEPLARARPRGKERLARWIRQSTAAAAAVFLLCVEPAFSGPAVRTPPPVAAPAGEPPGARITMIEETPVIDGRLAERCWQSARPLTGFFDIEDGSPADPQTRIQVLAKGRWLYVGATCESKDVAQAAAERARRDSDVFNDESLEVLLDPVGFHARVYRFVISSIGTRLDEAIPFDGRGVGEGRPCWLGRAQKRAEGEPDGWTAEFAIDLASLDLGLSNKGTWRANFIRHVRGPGRSDSAWARPRFWRFGCDKERMGVLAGIPTDGVEAGCALRVVDSTAREVKGVLDGRLTAEVWNTLTRRRSFDVILRTPTRWIATRRVEVPGRSRVTVEFPFEMALAEEHELKIEAIDLASQRPAAATAHRVSIAPAVEARFDLNYYASETQATFRVDVAAPEPSQVSVELRLHNSDTGEKVWSETPPLEARSDGGRGATVHLPVADLPVGGYLMETVCDNPAEAKRVRVWSALRRIAPREGEVKIGAGRYFLRDGDPFFPIEVRRILNPTESELEAIEAQSAFNVNWGWYSRWTGTDNYVKNLHEAIGCLGDVNVDDVAYMQGAGRDATIGTVQALAELPMMFAYGMEGLPGEEAYSTEPVAMVRKYMLSIDPHRPYYVMLGDPTQAPRLRTTADYLVVRCRAFAAGGIGEPEWAYEQVRQARRGAGAGIPVVALIPAYQDHEIGIERPTAAQVYAMTYLAVAAGAAGVIFDGFHYRSREDPEKRGFWDDESLRETIFALSHHLAFLGPILSTPELSETGEVVCEQPQYGSVRWTARRYEGDSRAKMPTPRSQAGMAVPGLYVIAVNASTRKAVAAFRGGREVRFDNVREVLKKRPVRVDGSRFVSEFGPHEAQIFAVEEKE